MSDTNARGVTCLACGEAVESTLMESKYGSMRGNYYEAKNEPCGCRNGGLRFNFVGVSPVSEREEP